MLPLHMGAPSGAPLSVLAIDADPDDIEIGAGGLPLGLAQGQPRVHYTVLTGTAERHQEARNAAHAFIPEADLAIELFDLPEGRLPAVWGSVKEILEDIAQSAHPMSSSRRHPMTRTRITGLSVSSCPPCSVTSFTSPMSSRNGMVTSAARRCMFHCRLAPRTARSNC